MGWGTEDVAGAGGRGKEDEAVAVKMVAGGGRDENVQFVVAFGCVSWNLLHWLSRREALRFHSSQVVGIVKTCV